MAPKRRKLNFTHVEKRILARGIVQYGRFLHGPESLNTPPARRRQLIQRITDQINAAGGGETRTPAGIQKKINDLRSVVRNKMARIDAHARGTGGGGPCPVRLTDEEWAVAQCFHPQQVVGLPGYQSDLARRTDGQEVAGTSAQEVAGPSGQEVAGPSGQAAAPPPRQAAEDESQEGQESPGEGSGHTSPHEEVEGEEVEGEEDEGEEEENNQIGWEVLLASDMTFEPSPEATPEAGSSQATIRGSPSHFSPNRPPPTRVTLSPPPGPQDSAAGRRPTQETVAVGERLSASVVKDNARQTRILGKILHKITQMEHSQGVMMEALGDLATNSTANVTCLNDLLTATTGVAQELSALTQAVQDNTRCGQANAAALTACLTRIAVAMEGRPAGEAPPSPPPPPRRLLLPQLTPPPMDILHEGVAVVVPLPVPLPVPS